MPDHLIYTIIVTYNGEIWIEKCLTYLNKVGIKHKIIVFDNNSVDNTVSIIERDFESVEVLKLSNNLEFMQANNLGIKVVLENNADYVLSLNQDVYIEKNTIEDLLKIFNKYPQYGILSPIHLSGLGDAIDHKFVL